MLFKGKIALFLSCFRQPSDASYRFALLHALASVLAAERICSFGVNQTHWREKINYGKYDLPSSLADCINVVLNLKTVVFQENLSISHAVAFDKKRKEKKLSPGRCSKI